MKKTVEPFQYYKKQNQLFAFNLINKNSPLRHCSLNNYLKANFHFQENFQKVMLQARRKKK